MRFHLFTEIWRKQCDDVAITPINSPRTEFWRLSAALGLKYFAKFVQCSKEHNPYFRNLIDCLFIVLQLEIVEIFVTLITFLMNI